MTRDFEQNWKTSDKEVRAKVCGQIAPNGQTVNEDPKNQVDSMTHFWKSLPNGPTKGPFWLWGGHTGLKELDFHSEGWFCWLHSASHLPYHMINRENEGTCWQIGYWATSIMEKAVLCSYGNRHVLVMGWSLLPAMPIKPIIHGLRECIIHQYGISHCIAFARGTHFFSKWGVARCVFREFTGNTLFPIIMKELGKRWNGILKSVPGPPRQQQFAGLDTLYTLNLG